VDGWLAIYLNLLSSGLLLLAPLPLLFSSNAPDLKQNDEPTVYREYRVSWPFYKLQKISNFQKSPHKTLKLQVPRELSITKGITQNTRKL
jgi:hypothetical protein